MFYFENIKRCLDDFIISGEIVFFGGEGTRGKGREGGLKTTQIVHYLNPGGVVAVSCICLCINKFTINHRANSNCSLG